MNPTLNRALLLALGVVSVPSFAAETTINGFASVVGGITTKSTDLPNGEETTYVADRGFVRNDDGSLNENAVYSDTLSFRPDTNYGLQFKSDLTRGLTVTAQIAGRGAQDFETELEWAYLSYELTPKAIMQAGRQRIPLYYYSDFIDVGYAYHWIRPPVEVYSNTLITYEGVSLTYNGSLGDWTAQTRIYTGSSSNDNTRFGSFNSDSLYGGVFNINNSWLRFRASYLTGDFYVEGTITDKDNAKNAAFGSVALNLTFGNAFIIAEATSGEVQDDYMVDGSTNAAFDGLESLMLSASYLMGSFTPHITYSDSKVNFYGKDEFAPFSGWYVKSETITAGVRWDFHPSAAFKIDYSTAKDKSVDELVAARGKVEEADVLSFGFDVIF